MRTTGWRAAALSAALIATTVLGTAASASAYTTGATATTAATAPPQVQRIAGDDRIGTAVAVSQAVFTDDDGAYAAFIASAASWPDALAASALAAQYRAPLLLVPADGQLPEQVRAELHRLKVEQVYVLGGGKSVSDRISAQLGDLALVKRFDGNDRYDTAGYAASVLADPGKPLYIASGAGFADALGGGAAAGAVGGALVLTDPARLPMSLSDDIKTLAPSSVVVLGGPGTVSDAVVGQLKTLLPGTPVTRTYGADRYETAARTSAQINGQGSPSSKAADGVQNLSAVMLASGTSFPDGLAGAAVSGPSGVPLLLTGKDCVPASTLAEVRRLGAQRVVVLGGPTVVSPAAAALNPC
ncbi:Putative cell wall binding repeat 2 [Quadrisphaera granulorum]|uniref:Putative cell wall binding repeat protein n=1 Tax=Quadrisphaera granulorum TaxID=317664 RepID=A0A316A512_9ACTN|nr:cell wall-binding repeat-containing protein [Quadrisphaera granulorum]PWJ53006.1 putative cell wall binding repeat protein [Quadrisphaera granulorum]SZE97171.1 Putative cell wall binding repeat 2 [Quadrisphaera granulorum]